MIGYFLKQGFTVLQHLYNTTIKDGAWASTILMCEIGAGGVILLESVNYYCYPHTDLIFTALKICRLQTAFTLVKSRTLWSMI